MFYAASWSLFGKSYQFLFYLFIFQDLIVRWSNKKIWKETLFVNYGRVFLLLHINTKMHKWKIIKLQQSSGKILFLKHFSYFLDLFFKVTPVLKPLIYFTIVIHKKWKKCTTVTSHFMNDKKKEGFFFVFHH